MNENEAEEGPYVDPAQASAKQAVDQEVAANEAARAKIARVRAMLDDFPFQPVGNRVVILQRRPDLVSAGKHGAKILLVRDESLMPLTGWIVAVPILAKYDTEEVGGKLRAVRVAHDPTYDNLCPYKVGDEVVFPEHASSPITVTIDDEEWTFLVMDYRDVLGKIKGGAVGKLSEVVPGLEDQGTFTAEDVRAAYPAPPEA